MRNLKEKHDLTPTDKNTENVDEFNCSQSDQKPFPKKQTQTTKFYERI